MLIMIMEGEVLSFILCSSIDKTLAYDEVGIRSARINTWQARKESAAIPTVNLGTASMSHPLPLPFRSVRL